MIRFPIGRLAGPFELMEPGPPAGLSWTRLRHWPSADPSRPPVRLILLPVSPLGTKGFEPITLVM